MNGLRRGWRRLDVVLAAAGVLLVAGSLSMGAQSLPGGEKASATGRPIEVGAVVQGGVGLTGDRNDFSFLMAGVHAGKVLTGPHGPGRVRGNFEYAAELFPFWQSYTPRTLRVKCKFGAGIGSNTVCSAPYLVGGTFSGVTLTPIILRWNFAGTRRVTPWVQGAGGILWTNHKYPAFGSTEQDVVNSGPSSDSSVWNFTPQGGVGLHYFVSARRSIDLGANAVHISSASLGDRNPGVNASVQFSLGYSWWK